MPEAIVFFVHTGVFLLLLVGAAFTDVAYGKIYNWMTVPAIVLGLGLSYIAGGWSGLGESVGGFGVGGGLFLIFFAKGWIGAGDVKLMAAAGALGGISLTFTTILLSTCVGAVMAIAMLLWRGEFWDGIWSGLLLWFRPKAFKKRHPGATLKMPYGVAVSIGGIWAWFMMIVQAMG